MEFKIDHQIKTGIFVVIGMMIVVLSFLYLGDEKVSLAGRYTLKVRLSQVQGLSPGSQVTLSGLRVGRIRQIDFADDSADLIALLEIDKSHQKRITQGAVAGVKTLGALGDKYIYITPGSAQAEPLQDGAQLVSDGGEDFLDILAQKSSDLSNVVNQLNILLTNMNEQGRSRVAMENLVSASAQFKALMVETRDALNKDKMKQVVDRMASIMTKIDKGDGTLGALINDPTLHQKLSHFMGDSPRRQFLKPLIRETIQHQENGGKVK